MSAVAGLLAVPATWIAYAWGSHAFTLGCAWRGSREGRRIALTFDDGPDPATTPRVLDLLSAHGVKASFFLIGERAARNRPVVQRMVEAGHDVGNHGWSHKCLWFSDPWRTADEVRRGHDTLSEITGARPRFYRPAWGMTNLALFPLLRRLHTRCVFWTVQTEGRRPASASVQVTRARRRSQPGAILDLHDADGVPGAGQRLLDALPAIIQGLRADGYTLVPLRDLL